MFSFNIPLRVSYYFIIKSCTYNVKMTQQVYILGELLSAASVHDSRFDHVILKHSGKICRKGIEAIPYILIIILIIIKSINGILHFIVRLKYLLKLLSNRSGFHNGLHLDLHSQINKSSVLRLNATHNIIDKTAHQNSVQLSLVQLINNINAFHYVKRRHSRVILCKILQICR